MKKRCFVSTKLLLFVILHVWVRFMGESVSMNTPWCTWGGWGASQMSALFFHLAWGRVSNLMPGTCQANLLLSFCTFCFCFFSCSMRAGTGLPDPCYHTQASRGLRFDHRLPLQKKHLLTSQTTMVNGEYWL